MPFLFSARLYPFGVKHGDAEMVGEVGEFKPNTPILFIGQTFDRIWVNFVEFKFEFLK